MLDKKIQRINLAFGEASFNFHCRNRFLAFLKNENLGNWLGFESLIEQEDLVEVNARDDVAGVLGGQPQVLDGGQGDEEEAQAVENEGEEEDEIASETGADDVKEAESLVFYFRLDEGQGEEISDITDNKFKCTFEGEAAWSPEPLPESEPIDYEDKWGKSNQPSYSLDITKINHQSLKLTTKNNKVRQNFSFEFWMKAENIQRFSILNSA